MPTGYFGEGKTYSRKLGKWITKEKEKVYDYDRLNQKSAALLVSFFRWYPDYFLDLVRSENAKYKLEFPQRLMLRIQARYRNTYITGARGLTKTFILVGGKMIDGEFFPGEIIRYCAPSQKQSATLASSAYKAISNDYPILAEPWAKNNDRDGMFRITTTYGSEFTMYAPRGDNSSQIVGEEMGQEGEGGFDMDTFENDVSPACRLERYIHKQLDRCHINLKEAYIANACSRENPAFTKYRATALKDMIYKDKYDGYAIDISWIAALLCNIRGIDYYKKEKAKLSPENWLREMCVRYIGNGENPMISDETLARSKKLLRAEFEHCGNPNAIYIVSHDVSYVDSRKNAKCADVVVKLTLFDVESKRDKYKAQIVFADNYPPPLTAALQAQKIKQLWAKYCMDGGETTYLVVDAQAYGTEVVENLMKPSEDGLPNLCCVNHSMFSEIEQPNAIPVIYPMKAGTRGSTDPDGEMIQYAQNEFEQGNVELLVGSAIDGVEAYKAFHGIKDVYYDSKIIKPYRVTELLAQQISNLETKASGLTLKEVRKSKAIQRDIWSALKYALRIKERLERLLSTETYRAKSAWESKIEQFTGRKAVKNNINPFLVAASNKTQRNNTVNRLLALRKRR